MGAQIEIGAVGDTLQLAPVRTGETEFVLDVDGALGIVGELFLRMFVVAKVVGIDSQVGVPVGALVNPVLVPLLVGAGFDEELHLHLLELTGTEDEVPGRDLVAERLTCLHDAERRLLPRAGEYILEIDENTLGSLRP